MKRKQGYFCRGEFVNILINISNNEEERGRRGKVKREKEGIRGKVIRDLEN